MQAVALVDSSRKLVAVVCSCFVAVVAIVVGYCHLHCLAFAFADP